MSFPIGIYILLGHVFLQNNENLQPPTGDAAGEMRSVGISSAGISADIAGAEDQASIEGGGEDGGEGTPPETATGDEGGAPPPPGDEPAPPA